MNPLHQALADYLNVRRALGYKLKRDEQLLTQFLDDLEAGGQRHVTTEAALAWATSPAKGNRSWWENRLTVVGGFAVYLRTIDPKSEVRPSDVVP